MIAAPTCYLFIADVLLVASRAALYDRTQSCVAIDLDHDELSEFRCRLTD